MGLGEEGEHVTGQRVSCRKGVGRFLEWEFLLREVKVTVW